MQGLKANTLKFAPVKHLRSCISIIKNLLKPTVLIGLQRLKLLKELKSVSADRLFIPRWDHSLSKEMFSNTTTVIYIQFVLVSSGDCNRVKCKEISEGQFNQAKYYFVDQQVTSSAQDWAGWHVSNAERKTFKTWYVAI